MDRPIVVFDTETATTQGAPHLLELGAVRVVDGEVADTFETLVCPVVEIEPEAEAVHGIGSGEVRSAPLAAEALARFTEWVGEDWMAAHRAEADATVLGFEYARARLTPPPGPVLDTLKLARRYLVDSPDHKLPTLAEHLELEGDDRHRALPDAVTAWKVLEECMERAGGLAATRLAELLTLAGSPITIESGMPRPARLSPRLRALERAIADDSQVTLIYGAGDEPPASLPVAPRFLYSRKKKSYLEAECLSSGLLKTYLLERVVKVV